MNVAVFGPASLQAQLAELERELAKRASVYPLLVAKGKLTQRQADYQTRGLEGAITTLRRLADAEARGEPGRREIVEALRRLTEYARAMAHGEAAEPAELDPPLKAALDTLARIPE